MRVRSPEDRSRRATHNRRVYQRARQAQRNLDRRRARSTVSGEQGPLRWVLPSSAAFVKFHLGAQAVSAETHYDLPHVDRVLTLLLDCNLYAAIGCSTFSA